MRIVLLGNRYSGKTSTGNTILGRQKFASPAGCVKREGEVAGRHITIVEAPGWWEDSSVENTHQSDEQMIELSGPSWAHAFLLVIRVDVPFTETHRRSVQMHLELLGERVWSHTIVLFSRGDLLGHRFIEQHIESGGEALQWVVEKCGNRQHVIDNKRSDGGQVTELLVKIEEMVAGNGGFPRKQAQSASLPPELSDAGYDSKDLKTESRSSTAKHSHPDMAKEITTRVPLVNEDSIKIMELIDRGSFGSVYQGSYLGSPVAVKMIPIEKYTAKNLEVIIPLRLFHTNIVKMLAVCQKEKDILIAYDYIHGANLYQIIHEFHPIKLSEEDKMYVALEIGMAVEYIHDKNIIHQDIKPANILVSERSKTAYLTDWGLANIKDSQAQFGVSGSGSLCGPRAAGTPLYKAPELRKGVRCSSMTDMWSLGVTYLEMFTGSLPWNLNVEFELLDALYNQEPPHALAKLQPHLTEIVEPMVQYEPQSRMNATDLVACLKSKVDLVKRYGFKF